MYNLNALRDGQEVNKELKVKCAEVPEGQEQPTIKLSITDNDIDAYEAAMSLEKRVYLDRRGVRFVEPASNKRFCLALSYAVTDSTGLFCEGTKKVSHSQQGLDLLISKVPEFAEWLADELTKAFKELIASYQGETVKN